MACGCSKNKQTEAQQAAQTQSQAEAQRQNLAQIRQSRELEAANKQQARQNALAK